MLARRSQLNPRVPPVHERIALQCARNICKLAATLPKPRTRGGYLPVMVELRRTDDNIVHRYQVNLPPGSVEGDCQQLDMAQAKAITQQLQLPCLVHGALVPSAQPQAVLPLMTEDGEPPQLVMVQDAVHVLNDREDYENMDPTATNDGITTFQNSAYASAASKTTRDHFMAILHNERPSPLQFETLWADQHMEGLESIEQVIKAYQPRPIELPGFNGAESQLQLESYTGHRLASSSSGSGYQGNNLTQQEPASVSEEQLPNVALNGYKQQPKPKPSRNQSKANSTKRVLGQPSEASTQPTLGSSGNRPQAYEPAFYCNIKDYIASQQQSRQRLYLPSGDPQEHRMAGPSPLYVHLPRIDSNGHSLDVQRELLMRQRLEQQLDYQRLIEQQKNQRTSTGELS